MKKYRWQIAGIFTFLYFLLIYFTFNYSPNEEVDSFPTITNYITWYVLILNFILYIPKNENKLILMYFKINRFEEIEDELLNGGYQKVNESDLKMKFKLMNSSFWDGRNNITIDKGNHVVWSIEGKTKHLSFMEKYMVSYGINVRPTMILE